MDSLPHAPAAATASRRRVVIVGGGFGGLACARALVSSPAEVTLIDRRNFHLFQPLLYQVASGALSPANIAAPLRTIFRAHPRIRVLLAEVAGFDLQSRTVLFADGGCMPFDVMVLAGGARPHYFGRDDTWAPLAPGLKTVEDATCIRRRVLGAFERAERTEDCRERAALMTFVVIGGGPTGVELAGAICELARDTLSKEFHFIDSASARIILVESGDRILDAFAPDLSRAASLALEQLGVEIAWGQRVVEIDTDGVLIKNGTGESRRVDSKTVIWAAGVRAAELGRHLAEAARRDDLLDRAGRVRVDQRCQVPGIEGVYVVGDMAAFTASEGYTLPGVAPVAMQQGAWVGRDIARRLAGRKGSAVFRYRDRGSMATIGRSRAVVQVGSLRLTGQLAWFLWLVVHVLALARFENRLLVSMQWFWNYITRNRSARLITDAPSLGTPSPRPVTPRQSHESRVQATSSVENAAADK